MALPKLYEQTVWHNNTSPALNEDNLNSMSQAIDDIDDRVIELAGMIMEDVPEIREDLEILGPAVEQINTNVERAETAADNAETEALKSEGYAVGKQDGVEVTSGEYYQNNAKYYAEIANPPIENTVDFTDIITISDAINKAAKDVRLKVEAVQDLHGYTKPWVGGAGKNKLKITRTSGEVRGVTITNNGDTLTLNGTATQAINPDVNSQIYLPDGDYKLSMGTSSLDAQIYGWNGSWVQLGHGTGDVAFTASSTYSYYMACMGMNNGQTLNNVKVYPMIRLATVSDATFEPYTNICPITGWDNAKVTRSGKNLCESKITGNIGGGGGIWNDTSYALGIAKVKKGQTYVYTSDDTSTYVYAFYTDVPVLNSISYNGTRTVTTSGVFTAPIDGYIAFRMSPSYAYAQCEVGTQATSYEPYQGKEITISLNGTRYGCTHDVTSGVLTVDKAYTTISSVELVDYSQSGSDVRWRSTSAYSDAKVPSSNAGIVDLTCNMFKKESADDTYVMKEGIALHPNARFIVYSAIWADKTQEEVNTILSSSPIQVVYPLATPITVQLTAEEVDLLYGYNTLFGDCGDISLTYDASGIIHIEEAKLDTETLKTIAAASSDFADFKARIAAL